MLFTQLSYKVPHLNAVRSPIYAMNKFRSSFIRNRWSLDGLLWWRHGHGSAAAHGSCTVARGEDVLFPLGRGGHSFGGHGRPDLPSSASVSLTYYCCMSVYDVIIKFCTLYTIYLGSFKLQLQIREMFVSLKHLTSLCAQCLDPGGYVDGFIYCKILVTLECLQVKLFSFDSVYEYF